MGVKRIVLIAMIAAAGVTRVWPSVAHGQAGACVVAARARRRSRHRPRKIL